MNRVFLLTLLALLCSACNKPALGNSAANAPAQPQKPTPAAFEKGLVVTVRQVDEKSLVVQWLVGGQDKPLRAADDVKKLLSIYARQSDSGLAGWDAQNARSENRVGLRIDARCPTVEFIKLLELLADAYIYKISVALLQEFEQPWNAGAAITEFDARFFNHELPTDAGPAPVPSEQWSVGLNLAWEATKAQCQISTRLENDKRTLLDAGGTLETLVSELSTQFKRKESGQWSLERDVIIGALVNQIARSKKEVSVIQIGNAVSAQDFKDPKKSPPFAFMLLALDAVFTMNKGRATENKPPLKVVWRTLEARGGRYSPSVPLPPTIEKPKPPATIAPWGDVPGEMFTATAAFTINVEKLAKPAANGAKFGYFFGESAQPRTELELKSELQKFAKRRDVKAGHPGWSEKEKYSHNAVAVRGDAAAPFEMVDEIMGLAYDAGIVRFHLGALGDFPASDYALIKAADGRETRPLLCAVGKPYVSFMWPIDRFTGRWAVPAERITLAVFPEVESLRAQYVTGIGARDSNVIENSSSSLADLCPELAANDDQRTRAKARRAELITVLAKAVAAHIGKSGARIELMQVATAYESKDGKFKGSPAFYYVLLAFEAGLIVNADRKAAGKPELELQFRDPVPLPPEPEMKPSEMTEWPKDEPPQEDPTEDPRIVEDAKEEHREDPEPKLPPLPPKNK